jgi:F-type H+-transporting ATPase subunit gamma
VTSRRQVEGHRHSLGEIRAIMNAMKNLAYMETRKLARFLNAQNAVVSTLDSVAADFVTAYPDAVPDTAAVNQVYLLIGSERGFCGDFNDALLRYLESVQGAVAASQSPALMVTGHKLHALLADHAGVAAFLDGASVAEEVPALLTRVVETVADLQGRHGALSLEVFYHPGNNRGVTRQQILPPFQRYLHQPERFAEPPVLNLTPAEFLIELSDHYLFAVLHQIFYASLMSENERRVQHLDAAVDQLDERSLDLQRQANALRQEEIIEEIEVILLSRSKSEYATPRQEQQDMPEQ